MDLSCAECRYDYGELTPAEARDALRQHAHTVAATVRECRPTATAPDGSWSALEYAGHVRDVLVVARERTLDARREAQAVVVTMAPDERVEWGEYERLSPEQACGEIQQVAEWLAQTWEHLSRDDWRRTLLYNYPEPRLRPLSWLAAHIIHELVHHRLDIQCLTVGS